MKLDRAMHYADIVGLEVGSPGSCPSETLAALHVRGMLGKALVAFPGMRDGDETRRGIFGNRIRLWSNDLKHLEHCLDIAGKTHRNANISPITTVGEHSGGSVCYFRLILPKAKQRKGDVQSRENHLRNRHRIISDMQKAPHLMARSHSNGNRFSISIERRKIAYSCDASTLEGNSYGLSRRDEPVWLPDIP